MSLGCLIEYDQGYMRGKPSKWQHGFAVFYFKPDGFFYPYPIRIFNHSFVSPEGKVYKGFAPREQLPVDIVFQMAEKPRPKCEYCGSTNVSKFGFRKVEGVKYQRYECFSGSECKSTLIKI